MFGVWKVKGYRGTTIKNTPIMFSDKDLLSDVKTGQLVYFDLEGNIASNIERASLSNFKLEYINSLITCKSNESEYSFYSDNTYISFERLDNIIIPNEDDLNQTEKNFMMQQILQQLQVTTCQQLLRPQTICLNLLKNYMIALANINMRGEKKVLH